MGNINKEDVAGDMRAETRMGKETKMRVVYGDCTLGLHGQGYDYIFNYGIKGLESLVKNGREWMYRGPLPTFWRALTDNDRGNGFHLRSGMWLAADQFICCKGIKVLVDGEDKHQPDPKGNNRYTGMETAETAEIIYTYATITVPAATVEVSYRVNAGDRFLSAYTITDWRACLSCRCSGCALCCPHWRGATLMRACRGRPTLTAWPEAHRASMRWRACR